MRLVPGRKLWVEETLGTGIVSKTPKSLEIHGTKPAKPALKEKAEGFDEVKFLWDTAPKCGWTISLKV